MRSVFLAFALAAAAVSCAGNPITTSGTGGAGNGGTTSAGGTTSNGGTTSSGGTTSTGGKTGAGGTTSNGGTTSSGGTTSTGGKTGTGGAPSTGGKTGTGGAPSTGGKTGTGGSSTTTSIDCTDTSTDSAAVTTQYGGTQMSVTGNSNKTYFMQANWWGSPYNNQAEDVEGLGFSMTNPGNVVTNVKDTPMGFPSIFIGSYGTKKTTGSNLPKQVSALTSVPTIFSTNVDTLGISNYNATYDVWFTSSNALVTGSSPGTGGAYLMVWLFKPSDRQPRGSLRANGVVVTGVKGGWDVWYDTTNPPCVSYVASDKIASLEFDLNNFIKDAVQNSYGITASQYLSIVFAGFEVWGGGDGLQIKKYCANVK